MVMIWDRFWCWKIPTGCEGSMVSKMLWLLNESHQWLQGPCNSALWVGLCQLPSIKIWKLWHIVSAHFQLISVWGFLREEDSFAILKERQKMVYKERKLIEQSCGELGQEMMQSGLSEQRAKKRGGTGLF